LVRAYHTTGRSNDRMGHVVAKYWLDLLQSDPEMQRKFAAGDPLMRRRFRSASIYLAGKHDGVSAADEAAYAATLNRGNN
jgi:hypothetical protein